MVYCFHVNNERGRMRVVLMHIENLEEEIV